MESQETSGGRGRKTGSLGAQTDPKVFTILLNWNGWQDTLECVRSLQNITYSNQSIVIVDNGSVGDDVQMLRRELGNSCRIVQNERNEGYCEGNNVGIRYALAQGADYILILNNDTVVAPGFLSHLVAVAVADPGVGVVVPCICLYDEPQRTVYPRVIDRWPLMLHVHVGLFFQFLKAKRLERATTIRLLDGCCFLVKRKVLEATGLFDPDYFVIGGSGDLGKLAMDLGCRIVAVPEAMIWAKVARSFGDRRQGALAYAYWAPRSEILFARKHLTWPHFLLFLTLLPLRTAAWLAAYGRRARTLAIIPAIARGIRDGFRFRITYWPLRGGGRGALDGSAVSSRR